MITAPLILLLLPLPAPFVPELADLEHFASVDVSRANIKLIDQYRPHLEACAPLHLDKADLYDQAKSELWNSRHAWLSLLYAQTNSSYPEYRLNQLLDLYKAIGPDAYYRGQMPDPVPLWCFTELP